MRAFQSTDTVCPIRLLACYISKGKHFERTFKTFKGNTLSSRLDCRCCGGKLSCLCDQCIPDSSDTSDDCDSLISSSDDTMYIDCDNAPDNIALNIELGS